jgi:pantothenate kinase
MMVGDIKGANNSEALEKLGLHEDLVASSFGKLVAKEIPAEGLKEEDLACALLLMVTNNIGQVACLIAQLHPTSRICWQLFKGKTRLVNGDLVLLLIFGPKEK